ncbi:MAG TPA: hypothetical protein VN711_03115 [Candidatus Saccharimonadales bacterium]|nr:hypothetical protein [Candidatus Saccharimonadales bacterium]
MFVTIINDCTDGNTRGRQETRVMRLLNVPVSYVEIGNYSELEAAGNLIDMLDATDGETGIILVNSAPRHGRGKKWPNGTPFGYFYYKNTLIITTVAEQTLSLAKKFGVIDTYFLTDIPTVMAAMVSKGKIDAETARRIEKSQFRSFDYVPRLAKWLLDGVDVPTEVYPLENIEDVPQAVWWVDNFGNCKLSVVAEDIGHEQGKIIKTKVGDIECFDRMKDVPNDKPGLIVGSSGLGNKRFLELIVQGQPAGTVFNLKPGDRIL